MLFRNQPGLLVDLMPMTIGSFDMIFKMNWLLVHRANRLYYEKAVRLPLPKNEALIIYGDKLGKNLRVISCMQVRKCLQKRRFAFLANMADM